MKIPKVFPFYRGLPDEFPDEEEYRQWDWQDCKVRVYEDRSGKSSSEIHPFRAFARILSAESMWRKIISYRNRK